VLTGSTRFACAISMPAARMQGGHWRVARERDPSDSTRDDGVTGLADFAVFGGDYDTPDGTAIPSMSPISRRRM
jgi:hypothetical protein